MGASALGPPLGRTLADNRRDRAARFGPGTTLRGTATRWWARAFALLAVAVCIVLPIGAIGTIDAGYDGSIVAPVSRAAGRHVAEQAEQAQRAAADLGALHAADGQLPVPASPRALLAPAPADVVVLLAAFVLLALVSAALPSLSGRPEPGLPRRRGPPSSR